MMSYEVFAVILCSVIVLGWIGFGIIAIALVRDSADALRNRKSRSDESPETGRESL